MLVVNERESDVVSPGEGVELVSHTSHKVEITGTVEKSETLVLKASAVKMVADSCEPRRYLLITWPSWSSTPLRSARRTLH